tara:strand:- start:498 stop:1148 length:651 start_codon:yes stop_codon:yes gene_type:complete
MALVIADRVQETTTTTGTGTYTLAGAKDGFASFSAVGDGNTTYYACSDGTDYEVGLGTYTASGTTLARTTVLTSSNSNNAVNWGAGDKDVFVTLPAAKAIVKDSSGDVTVSGTINATVFNATSDATLKTNIAPIENPLAILENITGVSFDWKNYEGSAEGVLAQDVEKVLPNAVNTDSLGKKSVSYNNLIGVLIEAVKGQQKQINDLKDKLGGLSS